MQLNLDIYSLGIISGLIASILFGISNVVYKSLENKISILDISVLRIWVSLPLSVFFIFLPFRSTPFKLPLDAVIPLSFSMIFGIIIGDGLYFLSQKKIGVARAYPIAMCYPLIVYTLSVIFLNEPIILSRVLGAFLVVVGASLIAHSHNYQTNFREDINPRTLHIGILLAVLTSFTWAIGNVAFQYGLNTVDPLDGNFVRMIAGSIALLPVYLFAKQKKHIKPSRRVISITLIAGTFGMGFSLLLGTFSVKYVGATVTAILVAAGPLLTTPLSMVYLKEKVPWSLSLGTLLTFLGIVLVILAL